MIVESKNFNIAQICDSGQCFRIRKLEDGSYVNVAFGRIIKVRQLSENKLDFDCDRDSFENIWYDYFDMCTDYGSVISQITANEDAYMKAASETSKGIRILRQEPFEMLISFIISQRKSIPAIRTSIEAICEKFGKRIENGIYAFPELSELSKAEIGELQGLGLGYRDKYIKNTMESLKKDTGMLESFKKLSDEDLIKRLMEFNGVGIKVANCVGLFGYHRVDLFPVDTWINKIINEHYEGKIDTTQFKGYAGIAQQYMFFYERLKNDAVR